MIKAVIFDLDDTIYDERQFVESGFRAVAARVSAQFPVDRDVVYRELIDCLDTHGRGRTIDIALQRLGISDTAVIPDLVKVYRMHEPDLRPYPEITVLLNDLRKKGVLIGLITDGDSHVQRSKVRALEIEGMFDSLVFSDDFGVGRRKPSEFPYLRTLETLKVLPEEAVYIGDNPHKDFCTARKLGMRTIRVIQGLYRNVRLSDELEAEFCVRDVGELSGLIRSLG